MQINSLEAIFRALLKAEAEYLVVGGVAVIAHGYVRLTQDLDLVLSLSSGKLRDSLLALKSLGYQPRVPVDILDFADEAQRRQWCEKKGMIVFNVFSPQFPDVTIDTVEPFDFQTEYARARKFALTADLEIPVVSLEQLMLMKRTANRPQDLLDLDKLRKISGLDDGTARP